MFVPSQYHGGYLSAKNLDQIAMRSLATFLETIKLKVIVNIKPVTEIHTLPIFSDATFWMSIILGVIYTCNKYDVLHDFS